MITPRFKFIDDSNIEIFDKDTGQLIGRIFSPASTIAGKEQAVQVCGFDYPVEIFGCGVFGYQDINGDYHAKKDIQLLWTNGDIITPKNATSTTLNKYIINDIRRTGIDNCMKCYSLPCKCDELRLYEDGEAQLEKL